MSIIVTNNAFIRVRQLLDLEQDKHALRVSVDSGGCSGLQYNYDLIIEEDIEKDDYIIEQDGIKIIIDPISRKIIFGCTLDFVEELVSASFQVTNPNAKAKCGCGNSFVI